MSYTRPAKRAWRLRRKQLGLCVDCRNRAEARRAKCRPCLTKGDEYRRLHPRAEYAAKYRDGHQDTNRVYQREYRAAHSSELRAWRRANKDRLNTHTNNRRALRNSLGNDLTREQWSAIKAVYRHCCAYCHRKAPLTQDHVIPLSKGGATTASNIVPACKPCNSAKRDREAPTLPPVRLLV